VFLNYSCHYLKNNDEKDEWMSTVLIDSWLNSRKLTLFAVHELNHKICSENSGQNCPKFWSNPLRTYVITTVNLTDHSFTFIAEPGSIPIFVTIRQHVIPPTGTNWAELEVIGNFQRLDGVGKLSLPDINLITDTKEDDILDPPLTSWPRNQSFMVADYYDFKDTSWFKISPRGKEEIYCGRALKLLILISSDPTHFNHRQGIRETYGSDVNLRPKRVRLLFLVGYRKNSRLQDLLREESENYDDIIQGNFVDSYHNLTLKHLSMFNWVQTTCQTVGLPKYVLKADDDFLFNIDLALQVAYQNPTYKFIGNMFCQSPVYRSKTDKYYTPRYMYQANRYPAYLSGIGYLIRTDIIPRLLKMSLTTPMIHMDDVYMTGILPRLLRIYPGGSTLFNFTNPKEPDACSTKKTVSTYAQNSSFMKEYWMDYLDPVPLNCDLSDLESFILVKPLTEGERRWCNYD